MSGILDQAIRMLKINKFLMFLLKGCQKAVCRSIIKNRIFHRAKKNFVLILIQSNLSVFSLVHRTFSMPSLRTLSLALGCKDFLLFFPTSFVKDLHLSL